MNQSDNFVFGRKNYMILIVAILLLIIGYVMLGLKNPTSDPESIFHKYAALKLTISPIFIFIAYLLLVWSIFRK